MPSYGNAEELELRDACVIEGREDSEFDLMAPEDSSPRGRWYHGVLLVFPVLAVSSAGAVMKMMDDAAPVNRAGWRLQETSLVLFPGFVWQLWWMGQQVWARLLRLQNLLLLLASAMALALHFGLWVWSIDHTSLPHSLIFVATPPIILAAFSWVRGEPISVWEMLAVLVSVFGVGVMSVGAQLLNQQPENEVTVLGDLAALGASIAFVVYISAGRRLRVWMPLFVYAFPVTVVAAILLTLVAVALEAPFVHRPSTSSPFGWLMYRDLFLLNTYLALGPGLVGHTGFNALLRHMQPLVISVALTLEPLLGSLFGWALGVTEPPGLWTWVGGVVLLGAVLLVQYEGYWKDALSSSKMYRNQTSEDAKYALDSDEEEGSAYEEAERDFELHLEKIEAEKIMRVKAWVDRNEQLSLILGKENAADVDPPL